MIKCTPCHGQTLPGGLLSAAFPIRVRPDDQADFHRRLLGALLGIGLIPAPLNGLCDNIRDQPQPLSEVTVFGTSDSVLQQPKSITVIDRQAILNAAGNSLIDLLAREANISPRSYTGNDKYCGIDIRGMGDTFSSNVLILVDGVRLNAPDLSGADLSTLSLGQIERIEVIRGGGGVLYGDGAVGGVVNIVTRKAKQTRTEIYNSHGSFDTFDSRLNAALNTDSIRASLNAAHYQTRGYRENTFLDKNQLNAKLAYSAGQAVELTGSFRMHDDEYGLAGPVDIGAIGDSRLRRQAATPYGGGETHDYAGDVGAAVDWGKTGKTQLKLAYRYRDNPYETANYWSPDQSAVNPWRNAFQHRELDLRHRFDLDIGPVGQNWTFGYYRRIGSVARHENGTDIPTQSQLQQADFDNRSGFVNTAWYLPIPLILNAGYRRDSFSLQREANKYDLVCRYAPVFPFQPLGCDARWLNQSRGTAGWRSYAADLGLTWNVNDRLTWYGSYNRSFRNPNPEELVLSAPDIQPQRGNNWETGWRARSQDGNELSLALFRMTNQQEIYYDNSVNRNYDETTRRRGLELAGKFHPRADLTLSGNFGYIDARFADSGLRMPLVPELKGQLGLLWHATSRLSLSVSADYVGMRNNGANLAKDVNEARLKAYQTVDLKAFYQLAGAEIFAGVGNLFNAFYETSAYGGAFYPMPGRQAYLGLTYTFPTTGDTP
ncbi:TonB-dependent receptor [Methylomonas rivi]|uniref:TonB-dependent receptor n=1 Tax=Methylomonas rivi TaxID=2952226 RepID=A0ABT1UAC8_9GAMM|nr:TonB-dependent receptor [Methylomonas sp. WSC-6]MCQ8130813.1 TonB-dependent receptor [Methylomonas sp. WSC-6]